MICPTVCFANMIVSWKFCFPRFMVKEVRGSHLIVFVLLLSNTLLMFLPGATMLQSLYTDSDDQSMHLRPFAFVPFLAWHHILGARYP